MARAYYTEIRVTDFGPYTTKIILPLDGKVEDGAVGTDTFSVYVRRLDKYGKQLMVQKYRSFDPNVPKDMVESRGFLKVTDAYPSDLYGNRLSASDIVTLDIKHGPGVWLSSELGQDGPFNTFINTVQVITQVKPFKDEKDIVTGLVFDTKIGVYKPDLYGWINSRSHYADCPLRYGYFVPQGPGEKQPLLIWLHGAGEGGTDTAAAYAGNKVTALSGAEVQGFFGEGGAYVLAPQTETFWMDSGTGGIEANGKTKYGPALKACIDEFIANNPAVDTGRICIGGDSNGGFMTVRMVLDYPDFFAAAFPVCEALPDKCISDEELAKIKDLPIWFVAAKTDTLVPPAEYAEPTYKRLVSLGNPDVHFSYWDKIEDLHGLADPVDGKPYEYFGHFSWIPLFNNDCDFDYDGSKVVCGGEEVSLLQWLAKH
ncbi:MAG: prolyl oligopeptidase family serine peptidase [Lachnospiraceae bacterium]|nr:prolyl oligopeptidase family serine peptidase [Lachnospiraceae bacterium]